MLRLMHAQEQRWCTFEHSQDRNDGLAILPPHLLDIPHGRGQIAGAARTQEQPVLLNKEPRHANRLDVRYPKTQKKERSLASNNPIHSASPVPRGMGGTARGSNRN